MHVITKSARLQQVKKTYSIISGLTPETTDACGSTEEGPGGRASAATWGRCYNDHTVATTVDRGLSQELQGEATARGGCL